MSCIFERTRLSACSCDLFWMSRDLSSDETRPLGIITRRSLNYVLGHLEWGELRKLHLCKWVRGCVCVPYVAFHSMPLVWFNHGSDVDLNTKCAWHQILDEGRACAVAVQFSTDSTYWRLSSFRFIRLIEPTHSKNSTLKCINLQWMIIRIPSSASQPGLCNVFVLTVNDDWVIHCNNNYFFCLRAFFIRNPPGRCQKIMYSAVVDWFTCAAYRGSIFFTM